MKRIIPFVCLLSALPFISTACDICGCGVGNSYIGILPDFSKHIFGVRYRYNSMLTHVGVGGATTYLTAKEYYHTAEAWGGWNITDKVRVMASVPYSFNKRQNSEGTLSKNGMGDVTLAGFYNLLNSRRTVLHNKLLIQSLWLGGGVKLATGKYNPADKGSTGGENANLFQLGTGSYDFNATAMYDVRLQDAGINLTSAYKINTANSYRYQYGNKFSLAGQLYCKIKVGKKATIAPNAGMQYETARRDTDDDTEVVVSGGKLLLGTAGMETVFNKVALGTNFQTPFSQKLASGIVKARARVMLHVSFVL
jgi:hypothetical protein